MKTIKRSIALVLAMVLTLAMSVTVFAEGEGAKKTFTITVNEAKAGHTYEAYQILKEIFQNHRQHFQTLTGVPVSRLTNRQILLRMQKLM